MIDKSKTYRTRDGREVRIYATDGSENYPVHGAILNNGSWEHRCWTAYGEAVGGVIYLSTLDLIEVRPRHKRTVWLNVYNFRIVPEAWNSKENADRAAACGRIACIKVELDFEEGEGL